MYYIGLDVHLRTTSMCMLDNNGKIILEKTIRGNIIKVFSEFDQIPGKFCVCYEASNGYGTLYDYLSKIASRVVVAHPGQVRLIFRSKRKTDRIDAQKLAKLLFLGEVPPVYVPDVNVRDWRHLITMRHWSVKRQTRCKNRLRSLLRHHAFEAPKNLWGRQGMQWLSALIWPTEEVALEWDLLCEE